MMTERQQEIVDWTRQTATPEQINKWFETWANDGFAEMMQDQSKRRDAIAGYLLMLDKFGELPDEVGSQEFVDFINQESRDFKISQHFYKNVERALDRNGLLQPLLDKLGQDAFDLNLLEYKGGNSYMYAGVFYISFQNSPFQIDIWYLG